jgi:transposase-like protein
MDKSKSKPKSKSKSKSKPEAKPSDAKRQHHSREFKIEAVRQLEEGKISGAQLALMSGSGIMR